MISNRHNGWSLAANFSRAATTSGLASRTDTTEGRSFSSAKKSARGAHFSAAFSPRPLKLGTAESQAESSRGAIHAGLIGVMRGLGKSLVFQRWYHSGVNSYQQSKKIMARVIHGYILEETRPILRAATIKMRTSSRYKDSRNLPKMAWRQRGWTMRMSALKNTANLP